MKSTCISFLVILFIPLAAFTQRDGSIKGRLQDTTAHSPVVDVTVTVLNAADSSLAAFGRSLASGSFLVKGLSKGNYRLLITHVSYQSISRNFMITDAIKDIDMGEVILQPKADMLAATVVEVAPVTVKHDTIEYNAGSFKTKPNAVVEDLLKKLPGLEVAKDGTIKANGEQVKKVLVDGKEFFGNDPKIATKNLPADAVDKVQVFDKKSDQSQFTGFDDGSSQRTLNLTIKKDKKHGVFGKATAGGGGGSKTGNWNNNIGGKQVWNAMDNGRYEGKLNVNQFRGDRQFSLIGMANNTNKQGFSFRDIIGFNGGMSGQGGNRAQGDPFGAGIPIQDLLGNNQAITTTRAGGLNFNDNWNKNTDISGNYFYNNARDRSDQQDTRHYLLPGNSFLQDRVLGSDKTSENHRFGMIADHRIDSFNSLKLSTSFVYQNSNSVSRSMDSSEMEATKEPLNNSSSNSYNHGSGYDWNSSALWRHRMAKKGRTLSLNFSYGLNGSTGGGNLHSLNNYFQSGNPSHADTLDQAYDLHGNGRNYGATAAYTEPFSKRSLLEMEYSFNQLRSSARKNTFDADALGKFTIPNVQQTSDFENTYTYHREGLRFRNQHEKYNFTIGASLQQADSRNAFSYLTGDSSIRQSFSSILPDANMQYSFSKFQNLRLMYNTFTNAPTVAQLQPVPDNSDPLNIRLGNPSLKQEYYHSLRLNYIAFDPFRRTSFFAMLSYSGIRHKIVNQDELSASGVRTTRPVNLDGLYNLNGNLSWGFPLRRIKTNLNLSSTMAYSQNASLVNGARNNSRNLSIGQEAGLNFIHKELLDISGSARVDYNDVVYSLQKGQNMSYWTQRYTLDLGIYLPHGFSVETDLDYTRRSGLPAAYSTSPFIWNAGLAKQVFPNKKGTIRLQVLDMLQQNTGFSRNTSQNYIEDQSYRTLGRYWLVSFTYNISHFAGKSMQMGIDRGVDVKVIR